MTEMPNPSKHGKAPVCIGISGPFTIRCAYLAATSSSLSAPEAGAAIFPATAAPPTAPLRRVIRSMPVALLTSSGTCVTTFPICLVLSDAPSVQMTVYLGQSEARKLGTGLGCVLDGGCAPGVRTVGAQKFFGRSRGCHDKHVCGASRTPHRHRNSSHEPVLAKNGLSDLVRPCPTTVVGQKFRAVTGQKGA